MELLRLRELKPRRGEAKMDGRMQARGEALTHGRNEAN